MDWMDWKWLESNKMNRHTASLLIFAWMLIGCDKENREYRVNISFKAPFDSGYYIIKNNEEYLFQADIPDDSTGGLFAYNIEDGSVLSIQLNRPVSDTIQARCGGFFLWVIKDHGPDRKFTTPYQFDTLQSSVTSSIKVK